MYYAVELATSLLNWKFDYLPSNTESFLPNLRSRALGHVKELLAGLIYSDKASRKHLLVASAALFVFASNLSSTHVVLRYFNYGR
jgi:hypothetical protein